MSRLAIHDRQYRVAVLGSACVGKSCLIARFVQDSFLDGYEPTIDDFHEKHTSVDGVSLQLEIVELGGNMLPERPTDQKDALQGRHMADPSSLQACISAMRGVLLVFDVTSKTSFEEVEALRERFMETSDNGFPMVIVGNKSDLAGKRAVSLPTILDSCQEWGNVAYYETSAWQGINVPALFDDLCRQIVRKSSSTEAEDARRQHAERKCVVM